MEQWLDDVLNELTAAGTHCLKLVAIACVVFGLFLLSFAFCAPAHAQVPAAAHQHQRDLVRIVQQEWGLSGPVAVHAAQIHQESTWRVNVESPAGAKGMAQFMPDTAAWIAEIHPDLGEAAPYSPRWSMRAMARYNRWHFQRIRADTWCDRWAFTLSAYNGGLGWVQQDRALAESHGLDPGRWWSHVERHSPRADWAIEENRDYVSRILRDLEPFYYQAGWTGGRRPCESGT